MPLHWAHLLVRPFCTRLRWKNRLVKRHKCRAPMAELLHRSGFASLVGQGELKFLLNIP